MSASILIGQYDHTAVLKLVGTLRYPNAAQVEKALHLLSCAHVPIHVDLSQAEMVDSTVLGLLAEKLIPQKELITFIVTTDSIRKQLHAISFDTTFHLATEHPLGTISYTAIPQEYSPENEQIRSYVRTAHEELIKIDKKNEKDYRRVIDCLDKKGSQ